MTSSGKFVSETVGILIFHEQFNIRSFDVLTFSFRYSLYGSTASQASRSFPDSFGFSIANIDRYYVLSSVLIITSFDHLRWSFLVALVNLNLLAWPQILCRGKRMFLHPYQVYLRGGHERFETCTCSHDGVCKPFWIQKMKFLRYRRILEAHLTLLYSWLAHNGEAMKWWGFWQFWIPHTLSDPRFFNES